MVAQLSSTRALAHGHLGEIEEATAAAEHGLAIATTLESAPSMIRNLAALGFLELSAGHSARASARLGSALDVARSTGYREPGQFVFVGNLIESLVATGDLVSAARLTEELEEQGERLDRGWARVSARRGRALLAAAHGRMEEAAAAVEDALRHHSRLPMPFETARTLLVKGQIERRRKRRGAARETLTQALDAFETLGAKAWAEQARAELARVSGRAARRDLTPTELRVARLVADGLSNKQAAAALFVSVKAVEKNLSRVYVKLGINSRAQLVRTVERGELPPPPGIATKE
jgi:DNA-binding CsgD family transcriptional regulator